ncbi:MAG: PhnD/SsuA/transferrin family substrate-binding protein, partial [Deltaproteobacteria bacterium]|nr:PhnD/SsuA/transferrin family substrate-binding protein [Deltaproteobacteria bacterium]
VLAKSPEVPANSLFLRKNIDPILKQRLKSALLSMDQGKEQREILAVLGASRFIAATPKDYTAVFEYAKSVGIDLETYEDSSLALLY